MSGTGCVDFQFNVLMCCSHCQKAFHCLVCLAVQPARTNGLGGMPAVVWHARRWSCEKPVRAM